MRDISNHIYYLSILGVVFTLPFDISVNSLAVLIHVAAWLFLVLKNKISIISELRNNRVGLVMMAFSIFYLLSALFRFGQYSDFDIALKNLEIRLPFLLFPLTLTGIGTLSRFQIRRIFHFFVGTMFIATFICFVFAVVATIETGSVYSWDTTYSYVENYFTYHRLASWLGIHAVYFSMYVTIAFFIVLINLVAKIRKGVLTKRGRTRYYALLVYFAIIIFLLNSITISIAFLLGLLAITLIYLVPLLHWSKKRMIGLGIVFAMVAVVFSIMMIDKMNIKESVLSYNFEDEYPNANWNSLTLRLAKWEIAAQVIKNEWMWGVGPGNIISTLDSYYLANNFHFALENHYNPHNQFLHTWITAGIFGLLLMMLIFVAGFSNGLQKKDAVFLLFMFVTFIFSLSESVLVVNKGIVFFCFFLAFFSFLPETVSTYLKDESKD